VVWVCMKKVQASEAPTQTVWQMRLTVISVSYRHHHRLALGAQNVVSGGSRNDTSGRTDGLDEANTRFSQLCAWRISQVFSLTTRYSLGLPCGYVWPLRWQIPVNW
jgi:hypothetical protein